MCIRDRQWNILVPHDKIQVIVEDGWITLKGEVPWFYQREEAEQAVRTLAGVKGVSNLITVALSPTPRDVKQRITESLRRAAQFDADRITVDVDGGKVILDGHVRSWAERDAAERAAWSAPGVTEVVNRITVHF